MVAITVAAHLKASLPAHGGFVSQQEVHMGK